VGAAFGFNVVEFNLDFPTAFVKDNTDFTSNYQTTPQSATIPHN
jgi:hypothetical protein